MANYTYDTVTARNGVKLHYIKTTAPNIYLVDLTNGGECEGDHLYLAKKVGVNGSFFFRVADIDNMYLQNIAIQNGASVGLGGSGLANLAGSGVLYYRNGQLTSRSGIGAATPEMKSAQWAQGGFSMFFGDNDWEAKMKGEPEIADLMTKPDRRTAMVGNITTKEIRLIMTDDKITVSVFRAAITSWLGIGNSETPWHGIMLDGGISAQIYVNQQFYCPNFLLTRTVPQMIAVSS